MSVMKSAKAANRGPKPFRNSSAAAASGASVLRDFLKRTLIAGAAAAAALLTGILTGQQPPAPAVAPYTAAQADAGRAAYQANCANCHAPDLSGRNDASQLAGSLFMGSWGGRTTADLVGFIQGSMPPGNAGGLPEATYLNIAAFILDSNGARPGTQPLTTQARVGIRTIATGQQRAQPAVAAGGRGGRGGAPGGPLGGRAEAPVPTTPRGLTVSGEVKNYTPVTDAMLRKPDPAD